MKKDSDAIRSNYGELLLGDVFLSGALAQLLARQNTIGSLADRALQSKQRADVKLAAAVANAQQAGGMRAVDIKRGGDSRECHREGKLLLKGTAIPGRNFSIATAAVPRNTQNTQLLKLFSIS